MDENGTNVDESLTWIIPLIVVPQNDLNFTFVRPLAWMKDEKKITVRDLPSSNYFVIVNPEEIGDYFKFAVQNAVKVVLAWKTK